MKRNGFRKGVENLYQYKYFGLTSRLFFASIALLLGNFVLAGMCMLFPNFVAGVAGIGWKPKFNKEGATADNLLLLNDLEQRFQELPESFGKEQVAESIRTALEPFKDLDVEAMKEALGKSDKGLRAILLAQGEEITKLKGRAEKEQDFSLRGQIADWAKRNKEAIAKIREGNKEALGLLTPLEIRAANSPMTPANTISDTVAMNAGSVIRMGGEVFDLRRIQPTFWDYLVKGFTNLENLPWVNKKVPAASGAAAFIGPGVAKPGVSFTLEVENSNAKKIAVSLKTTTELLEDVDGFASFINDELKYQLDIQTNADLMTGVGSSTKPAGVQTFSLGFTTSGLSTTNPNNWDCARAVIAQIRKAYINSPVVIFMNPIDTANMDMEKAVSMGTYMGLNARPIPGGVIVEDNNIAVGYLQAIAIDVQKTKIYKDFILKFGWENDDFTKNLVTAIAERRIHFYHSENDAAGFVYDDLADIKSQIAAG